MARNARTNALGLGRNDYTAGKSTLCPGCGHDSISNQIIRIAFELGLEQHNVIKMSGIGCSSKTPAYFLGVRTPSTPSTGACPPSSPAPPPSTTS